MATMAKLRFDFVLIFVLFILCLNFKISVLKEMPTDLENIASGWVDKLNTNLTKHSHNATLYSVIYSYYQSGSSKDNIKFEVLNSTELVQKMSIELEEMTNRKKAALKKLVDAAEIAAEDHDWKADLQKDTDVKYYNSKDPTTLAPLLARDDDRFKDKDINTSISSVHIPVEIYEGDIDILNGLKWSEALDPVFEENYENDKEILWQYFGSQTGFMRTFPASLWGTPPDGIDLYDVRRRPWYTQGSSSPKDMLILIDKSGSVHGQSLQLIKVAVKSILDTLGENDFVKIVQFSSKAENVSCFDKFVQANYRNKMILFKAVDDLEAREMANFQIGLQKAFDDFDVLDNESYSAGCNRMIMLLTDGGTDSAENVFKERNWSRDKDKQIRVFTYAIGQTSNPFKDIRWMACANRGRFSEIPAMGAIRARVQDYVDVISRPLASQHIEIVKWTSSYTGSYRSRGLGMMTTITLPVYNRSSGASNQTILGVMGIDVTTKQMEKFSPRWKLGPNGYTFAINTNGYVIFHPNLKVQGYLKDPPNMDFLDVEVENEAKIRLRDDLIDRKTNITTIDTYVVSPDERHVDRENRQYAYTDIGGTTFSLGLSLPSSQQFVPVMNVKMSEIAANLDQFKATSNLTELLLAPWDYYENFTQTNTTLEDMYKALQSWDSYTWDEDKMKHLYWDLNLVTHVNQYWKDMQKINRNVPYNMFVLSFYGTYGGLTQILPKSKAAEFKEDLDTWQANYFRRAIDSEKYIYQVPYPAAKRNENDTMPRVMVVKSVDMFFNNLKFKPVVVGALLEHRTLLEMMEAATQHNSYYGCSDTDKVQCYLLDDGAFLVATNQDSSKIGQFFRDVDKEIMFALYNTTYDRLEEYDFQGMCKIANGNQTSAGTLSFRIPSVTLLFDFLTVNWWNSFWSWSLMNFNVYNWLFPQKVEAATPGADTFKSCIKKQAQYHFRDGFTSKMWQLTPTCSNNCSRDFYAERLPDSNLLFVIAYPADCPICNEETDTELIQEPKEDAGPDFCHMTPRYRKNPEKCYDYDPEEDTDECGGPLSQPVSTLLVTIATITTMTVTWCITPR